MATLRILHPRQTAVVVASDEQAQQRPQFLLIAGEATAAPGQGWHLAAQIGIGAFHGVGLALARRDLMTRARQP